MLPSEIGQTISRAEGKLKSEIGVISGWKHLRPSPQRGAGETGGHHRGARGDDLVQFSFQPAGGGCHCAALPRAVSALRLSNPFLYFAWFAVDFRDSWNSSPRNLFRQRLKLFAAQRLRADFEDAPEKVLHPDHAQRADISIRRPDRFRVASRQWDSSSTTADQPEHPLRPSEYGRGEEIIL
jgi:hypothetical protein